MKDLAIFTALNHSGTSRKNFVNLKKKKITYVIYRLQGSVHMVKNCDLSLENATLSHSISPYRRQITCIYPTNR